MEESIQDLFTNYIHSLADHYIELHQLERLQEYETCSEVMLRINEVNSRMILDLLFIDIPNIDYHLLVMTETEDTIKKQYLTNE